MQPTNENERKVLIANNPQPARRLNETLGRIRMLAEHTHNDLRLAIIAILQQNELTAEDRMRLEALLKHLQDIIALLTTE